jgi:ATP-dependent Clp protease adaptor protein ClpS
MAERRAPYRVDKPQEAVTEPPMFHVVLLNDDYTSMEFVVKVIQQVFGHPPVQASRIMMEVHTKGRAVVGTFVRDIARTKAETVMQMAFKENYPLKCILEKA